MGMYTEFIFGCSLSKDTPKICIDALDYVINGENKNQSMRIPKLGKKKNIMKSLLKEQVQMMKYKPLLASMILVDFSVQVHIIL